MMTAKEHRIVRAYGWLLLLGSIYYCAITVLEAVQVLAGPAPRFLFFPVELAAIYCALRLIRTNQEDLEQSIKTFAILMLCGYLYVVIVMLMNNIATSDEFRPLQGIISLLLHLAVLRLLYALYRLEEVARKYFSTFAFLVAFVLGAVTLMTVLPPSDIFNSAFKLFPLLAYIVLLSLLMLIPAWLIEKHPEIIRKYPLQTS